MDDLDFASAPGGSFPPRGSRGNASGGSSPSGGSDDRPYAPAVPRPGPPPVYLDGLNDKQREAALMIDGPLIVLAGAGSGKTKMLTSRISYLIQSCDVMPWQILAVTFTNKAAAEMRERVEKMLDQAAKAAPDRFGGPTGGHGAMLGHPEIGTFHAVCVRLLRREMARTPFTKPFVIYDDSDQLSLVKSAMEKLGLSDKSVNPKGVQSAINRLKCDAVEPHEMEPSAHNVFERHVKRVYEQYQKDLFANNAMDFGEIITLTYRVLRDHEDVRRKYQKRWRYLHVDEYQDTNRAQYLLLSMLASKRHGGHQNICVVGDEDQSIYKWRGADIRNIMDFESDYGGAYVVKLEQNYRSTQNIIKAAGAVIRNNRSRKEKTLWTDNDVGNRIVRAQVPDERAEAEFVVGELKRIAADEGRVFDEFAIFYRTNAQSRQFEDVLRREKIPYQIVGGLRFYDRKEIKDVLSYFKAILNPSDSVNVKRIINVPARGIGKTTLDRIDEYYARGEARPGLEAMADAAGKAEGVQVSQTLSYWDVLCAACGDSSIVSPAVGKKISGFVTLLRRLQAEQPKLLLSELYHLILDETGYVRELRQEGTEESMARIENLEELDTLLQEFEEDYFAQLEGLPEEEKAARKAELLPAFIEQSTLASDAGRGDVALPSVRMMTLHSSKGLEFPVVFMVGMEEGLFPSIKPWEETPEEDIEEERRLCYVGMTRARESLFLLNVLVRRFWGNTSYQEPSRFFAEMPADLIELRDFTGGQRPVSRLGNGMVTGQRPASGRSDPRRTDWDDDVAQEDPDRHPRTPPGQSSPAYSVGYVPGRSTVLGTNAYGSAGAPPQREMVGRTLTHPEYGPGRVIASEGTGEDRKITVEFRGRQQKKFVLRYVAEHLD